MTRKYKQKSPLKKAKDKAWNMFSKYIRLRDCLETTGKKDEGVCRTCGKVFPFKKLQAGHAIPGRNNSILCDPEIVFCQCQGCNLWGGGRIQNVYTLFIIEKYGVEFYEKKVRESNQLVKYTESDWESIYQHYKELYELLDKQDSIC